MKDFDDFKSVDLSELYKNLNHNIVKSYLLIMEQYYCGCIKHVKLNMSHELNIGSDSEGFELCW